MATNTNSNTFRRIGLMLLLALPLLLTGCGQKGNLYHPDQASRSTIHAA